jgi:hypothetical protein
VDWRAATPLAKLARGSWLFARTISISPKKSAANANSSALRHPQAPAATVVV